MQLIWQSIVLILTFGFVFLWQMGPLGDYTIQALGFLVFIYLITSARKKNFTLSNVGEGTIGICIVTAIILLLIFSTGRLSSPLFFLLYFLNFGIAFVFEPPAVFVFTLGCFLIFLPDTLKDNITDNLLRTGSLFLISPIAYFFGKEYRDRDKEEKKMDELKQESQVAADNISHEISDVLSKEKNVLQADDIDKLNDTLEQTESLREKSKE